MRLLNAAVDASKAHGSLSVDENSNLRLARLCEEIGVKVDLKYFE